jgi:hypothetical protein
MVEIIKKLTLYKKRKGRIPKQLTRPRYGGAKIFFENVKIFWLSIQVRLVTSVVYRRNERRRSALDYEELQRNQEG